MTRLIHVVQEESRVEVTFFGPVSFSDRIKAIEAVAPQVNELGLKGVLIDYTQAWVDESSLRAYDDLEERIRACRWLEGMSVALVSPAEFHALPTEHLSAQVGFVVRRFYTRPAAMEWLTRRRERAQMRPGTMNGVQCRRRPR